MIQTIRRTYSVCIYLCNRSCIADDRVVYAPVVTCWRCYWRWTSAAAATKRRYRCCVEVVTSRDRLTECLRCLAGRALLVSSCLTPVPCCASYNCTAATIAYRVQYVRRSCSSWSASLLPFDLLLGQSR